MMVSGWNLSFQTQMEGEGLQGNRWWEEQPGGTNGSEDKEWRATKLWHKRESTGRSGEGQFSFPFRTFGNGQNKSFSLSLKSGALELTELQPWEMRHESVTNEHSVFVSRWAQSPNKHTDNTKEWVKKDGFQASLQTKGTGGFVFQRCYTHSCRHCDCSF